MPLKNGYIHLVNEDTYLFDLVHNKIYKSKNAELNQFLIRRASNLNIYIEGDKIVSYNSGTKLFITYPASTGRNFVEVLRVIDSLQLTANYSVATPANWKDGEDVIVVPAIKTEDALVKFPKGLNIVKPYLRYTPQPNK